MSEGSTRGRLGGRGCSEAAEADCPTKAGREVVGSVEGVGLQTTPLARRVRPEEREGTRTGPGRPKDDKKHPRRRPGDPGRARNKAAVSR